MIHADLFFFASYFYSHTDRHNTAHSDIIENTATEFGRSSVTYAGYSASMGYPLSLLTASIMQACYRSTKYHMTIITLKTCTL